ncbi:hypothetical protein F5050DRAFT_1531532, partial [Lentinula boryana]
ALWILHKAGWVHRDISGGNVYWYQEGQTGLIGDFEYAKVGTDRGRHDVRTGTPFFMAAETLHRKYLFEEDELLNAVPFHHNPLHDLESVWWIIIYILFFNDDEESLSPAPEARQHQMERLFDGQLENMARFTFLK